MSYGRVPVLYQPSPTSGCRNTTPTTPLSTVDASKRVHNPPAGSYEPMRQCSTHSDALDIDRHQNPKDTSIRRVPSLVQPPLTSGCRTPIPMTSAPPVDVFSRVHNTTGPRDSTSHVSTHLDAPTSIKTNYNPSHGYHNTTRRMSMCFDTLLGADVYNTKDTSSRRVSSLRHPSPTSGHRTLMPTASAPPMDASSRVHNPSPGRHDPAHRKSNPSTSQYGSTHRMTTRFDITSLPPPLDVSLDVDGNPSHGHHDLRRRK